MITVKAYNGKNRDLTTTLTPIHPVMNQCTQMGSGFKKSQSCYAITSHPGISSFTTSDDEAPKTALKNTA
jgi:hypothetical protein